MSVSVSPLIDFATILQHIGCLLLLLCFLLFFAPVVDLSISLLVTHTFCACLTLWQSLSISLSLTHLWLYIYLIPGHWARTHRPRRLLFSLSTIDEGGRLRPSDCCCCQGMISSNMTKRVYSITLIIIYCLYVLIYIVSCLYVLYVTRHCMRIATSLCAVWSASFTLIHILIILCSFSVFLFL